MAEIDKPGAFYLGRPHDLKRGETGTEPLLYDSKDLTTHAVCVGMTGSGKTGLCLALMEEAALGGIPALAIDPKGDLGNLLLAFPNLAPGDFKPWIDESEAARKQMSPDEFAASQAELWRNGLAKWDQGPDRIRRFCNAVDRVIYTPGSSAGIPITVLKSFAAPPKELIADADAFGERIASATSGLLALLGIDADPVRSREHIFLATLLDAAWRAGKDVDLRQLIQDINRPPISTVGAVNVESFYPAKDRTKLAMSLNNLLASPSFASWLEGEPLDIQKILYTPEGKPRLAIMSIAHLDDAQRMFFVTILLNEVLAWIRTQPGTSSLRALLYMDEVFGYFPPLGNPPAKRPMLTLLKQARAYGLGCVLATQNPVDLDYKGLSNAGTWFLGRLQTERDKARVMEGLEGASAQAGASFNKQEMEAALAALGNRVFLMNNVHENAPVVFQTRWAMSYLCGPLTRTQIKKLMDPARAKFQTAAADRVAPEPDGAGNSAAAPPAAAARRPIVPAGIREKFLTIEARVPDDYRLEYRPGLVGKGKVHFVRKSDGIDVWQTCYLLQSSNDTPPDDVWQGAAVAEKPAASEDSPDEGANFAELPSEFARERSYAIFVRQLKEHLYREMALKLWRCEALSIASKPGETEADFRGRLKPLLDEQRKIEWEQLIRNHAEKIADADDKIERCKARRKAMRWDWWTSIFDFLWVIVSYPLRRAPDVVAIIALSVINWLFRLKVSDKSLPRLDWLKRRGRPRSPAVAFRKVGAEREQLTIAKINLDRALKDKSALAAGFENWKKDWEASLGWNGIQIEPLELKPQKDDIEVDDVSLVWLPWRVSARDEAEPVYRR